MTGSDEGERKVTGRRSRDSAIIPARESFYSDYFQFLAAIGRVLCANQPTRLADPVAGPLPRRSLGETERLTWTGKKKKGGRGKNGEDRDGEIIGDDETFSILYRGNLSPKNRGRPAMVPRGGIGRRSRENFALRK